MTKSPIEQANGMTALKKRVTIEEIMRRKSQYLMAVQPIIGLMASIVPQKLIYRKSDPLGDCEAVYSSQDQETLDNCKKMIDQMARRFLGDLEDCIVIRKTGE